MTKKLSTFSTYIVFLLIELLKTRAKEEYKVSTDKIEVDNEFVEEVNNKIKIIREKCK